MEFKLVNSFQLSVKSHDLFLFLYYLRPLYQTFTKSFTFHLISLNTQGKINVFIKSCTISLKHNDWFFFSPLFTQFKKLT